MWYNEYIYLGQKVRTKTPFEAEKNKFTKSNKEKNYLNSSYVSVKEYASLNCRVIRIAKQYSYDLSMTQLNQSLNIL